MTDGITARAAEEVNVHPQVAISTFHNAQCVTLMQKAKQCAGEDVCMLTYEDDSANSN